MEIEGRDPMDEKHYRDILNLREIKDAKCESVADVLYFRCDEGEVHEHAHAGVIETGNRYEGHLLLLYTVRFFICSTAG